MKKILLLMCSLVLLASLAYGQNWNPTPMVIEVPATVLYPFNGSQTDITFDLSGKGGKLYLVVNSKLDDSQKPVAVMNGFRGWHFVNGIDTTMYVSGGRDYTPGRGLKFPWDGHGAEKQYDSFAPSGVIPPGTYSYYILGYDNKSNREIANNFLEMGHFQPPQGLRPYAFDDKTGALLAHPFLLGKMSLASGSGISGTVCKFALGDDPYDASKILTTYCPGFKSGEVVPGKSIGQGSVVFNLHDFDTFYFTKAKIFEYAATVSKWRFVPGGEAIPDLTWGDWSNVSEFYNTNDNPGGTIESDVNGHIFWNLQGKNPVNFQVDKLIGFPEDDPTDVLFNTLMDEYYSSHPTIESDGVARTDAEAGRLDKGPKPGQFYMCGDATCCLELVDAYKMIDGATKPWKADGSGYVVWTNSNGDWFGDKGAAPETSEPDQLWACISFEPRDFNNMRMSPSPAEENGFMAVWLEFSALYSCGPVTQDGTGIDFWRFADDSFSSGGDNQQKKGNGYALGAGTQFDGLYTHKPMLANPAWSDASYRAVCWFPWDSDGGLISNIPLAVEDAAPVAFTVAQNSPNPFNPTTAINFSLAKQGQVSVDVFNVAGQKVDTLLNDTLSAGSHSVTWDASGAAAGVYFYTVKSGDYSKTMKMTLLK